MEPAETDKKLKKLEYMRNWRAKQNLDPEKRSKTKEYLRNWKNKQYKEHSDEIKKANLENYYKSKYNVSAEDMTSFKKQPKDVLAKASKLKQLWKEVREMTNDAFMKSLLDL
jgi:hypothetical protein